MELLLTTLILFAFTLLVPGIASQEEEDPAKIREEEKRIEDRLERLREINEEAERAVTLAETRLKIDKQSVELKEKLREAEHRASVASIKFQIEEAKQAGKSAEIIENLKNELNEVQEKYETLSAHIAKADKVAEEFTKTLGIATGVAKDAGGTIVGSFIQAVDAGVGLETTLGRIGERLRETYTLGNIATSVYRKFSESTLDLAMGQDQTVSSFVRATGASREYGEIITDVQQNNLQFGVSIQEAGAAVEALYTGMATFTLQSEGTRYQLAQTVALMNEFGISNDVAAGTIDTMVRVLGMTATEAAETSAELANYAESIGVPPARLMQELSTTAPMLAQWGDQTTNVLMELTAVSKATGVEMGALIGIAQQFDQFETGAEAVGRLNSILGGPYLNSVEMLNANEADRIRMLHESLALTGRSFDELGRFERQAIASAAGISDMSQAAAIFGGDLEANLGQLEAQNAAQETLAERAREAQSVYDMLQSMIHAFAIELEPVIKGLRDAMPGIIETFKDVSKSISDFINSGITQYIGSLIARFGPFIAKVGVYTTAFKFMLLPIQALAGPIGLLMRTLLPGLTMKLGMSARGYTAETAAIISNTAALRANNAQRMMGGGMMMGPGMGRGRVPGRGVVRGGRRGIGAGVTVAAGSGLLRQGGGRAAAGLGARLAGRGALGFLGPIGAAALVGLTAYDIYQFSRSFSGAAEGTQERHSPSSEMTIDRVSEKAREGSENLRNFREQATMIPKTMPLQSGRVKESRSNLTKAREERDTRTKMETNDKLDNLITELRSSRNTPMVLEANKRELFRLVENGVKDLVRVQRRDL